MIKIYVDKNITKRGRSALARVLAQSTVDYLKDNFSTCSKSKHYMFRKTTRGLSNRKLNKVLQEGEISCFVKSLDCKNKINFLNCKIAVQYKNKTYVFVVGLEGKTVNFTSITVITVFKDEKPKRFTKQILLIFFTNAKKKAKENTSSESFLSPLPSKSQLSYYIIFLMKLLNVNCEFT